MRMAPDLQRGLSLTRKTLWAILLISLPVTSFPFFPGFMGLSTAIVRPLALYPLLLLLLLEVIPSIVQRKPLPAAAGPILAFCVAAAAATAFSMVTPPFPLAGQTPLSRAIRAFVTLGIGIGFLMTAWRMSTREHGGEFAARWILIGSAAALLWGGLQAIRLNTDWPGYEQMNILHRLVSVRDMHIYRVTGLAYEPSWYADYLVVLVFPLLLAALVTGVHPFGGNRWAPWITGGWLAISLVNLLFTYSRGGIGVFIGLVLLLFLLVIVRRSRKGPSVSEEEEHLPDGLSRQKSILRWAEISLAVVVGLVVLGVVLVRNDYVRVVFSRLDRIGNLQNYLVSIGSGPRLALWQAAFGVFLDRPFIGVGLGQSGFRMWDELPVWIFNYRSEIMETFASTSMGYPNPKNLWIRLLAETGILGISLFLLFLALVLLLALRAYWQGDRHERFIGLFGILSLAAVVVEGVSLDSFANPTVWMAAGIVLGVLSGRDEPEERQNDDG